VQRRNPHLPPIIDVTDGRRHDSPPAISAQLRHSHGHVELANVRVACDPVAGYRRDALGSRRVGGGNQGSTFHEVRHPVRGAKQMASGFPACETAQIITIRQGFLL